MGCGASSSGWGQGAERADGVYCNKIVTYKSDPSMEDRAGCRGQEGQGKGRPSWGQRLCLSPGLTSPASGSCLDKAHATCKCPLSLSPAPTRSPELKLSPATAGGLSRKEMAAGGGEVAALRSPLGYGRLPPAAPARWPWQGEASSDWPRPALLWSCHPGHDY